ncbi:MAG: hypothetical protein WCF90_06135 [Methanomicrobiales archaeon]
MQIELPAFGRLVQIRVDYSDMLLLNFRPCPANHLLGLDVCIDEHTGSILAMKIVSFAEFIRPLFFSYAARSSDAAFSHSVISTAEKITLFKRFPTTRGGGTQQEIENGFILAQPAALNRRDAMKRELTVFFCPDGFLLIIRKVQHPGAFANQFLVRITGHSVEIGFNLTVDTVV